MILLIIQKGNMEKTKRNKKIYKDRKVGMSWTKLSLKYGLSIPTLRNIALRLEVKTNRLP